MVRAREGSVVYLDRQNVGLCQDVSAPPNLAEVFKREPNWHMRTMCFMANRRSPQAGTWKTSLLRHDAQP